MDELEKEIKTLIIAALELEGVREEDIESHGALFGEGLNLDSIDALELGLALKNKYNVRLDGDSEASRKHFYSVASLALFVDAQRNQP